MDDTAPVGEEAFVREQKQQEEAIFSQLEALQVEAELKQAPTVPADEPGTQATKSPEGKHMLGLTLPKFA